MPFFCFVFVCLVFFSASSSSPFSGIGGCEIGPVNASQKDDCQVRQKNMQPLPPKQELGGSRLVGD